MSTLLNLVLALVTTSSTEPQIVEVGMVAPDIVAVTIQEGDVELGQLVPYIAKPSDEIKQENVQRVSLRRDGVEVGTVAGPEGHRMIRLPDRFSGERIDRKRLANPENWSISGGRKITSVTYKNRVRDAAHVQGGDWKAAFEFIVYLQLDAGLAEGDHHIQFDKLPRFKFAWDDARTISPAVHVSAIGFRPDDPGKRASLTCWMGERGAFDYLKAFPGLKYHVVEHASGRQVISGDVTLRQKTEDADDYTGLSGRADGSRSNRAGGPVFALDLAALTQPGVYRIVVDGVGSSRPFRIDRDVYDPLWRLALRGLHVHRRNVALQVTSVDGETWTRPAADDSGAVYSTARMGNATFDAFVQGATDRLAPHTRGGWMDAGDFDTNPNHYWVSLMLLDLIDRHPQSLAADDVGISDSGNGRADLLDEAMWMIESYRAMQDADGSVTSGIEYSEHPRQGEPSHLNTLAVYRLAPSPRANYRYAAAAARAVRVRRALQVDRDQLDECLASAAKAFAWAEKHRLDPKPDRQEEVDNSRLLASCELMLAGHPKLGAAWLDYADSLADNQWAVVSEEIAEAIVAHLRLGGESMSTEHRESMSRVLYQSTNMGYLDGSARKSGFGVLKNGWAPFGFGIGACPHPGTHHVLLFPSAVPTNDPFPPHIKPDRDEYVAAGVMGLAFVLGHHPTNYSYVTGLETLPQVDDSWQSVHNILHLDSRYAGHRAPVGITVYGAVRPIRDNNSWPINWPLNRDQTVHPTYELWPEYENLHQFPLWGAMTEYTIWQSIGPTIWFAAELHAREADTPNDRNSDPK